jgi:hypothetical protein
MTAHPPTGRRLIAVGSGVTRRAPLASHRESEDIPLLLLRPLTVAKRIIHRANSVVTAIDNSAQGMDSRRHQKRGEDHDNGYTFHRATP